MSPSEPEAPAEPAARGRGKGNPLSEPLQEVPSELANDKRGRGKGTAKPEKKRANRDYVGELRTLQANVAVAIDLLDEATRDDANPVASAALVRIALRRLRGKEE